MKYFWIFILILAGVTTTLVLMPSSKQRSASEPPPHELAASQPSPIANRADALPESIPTTQPDAAPVPDTAAASREAPPESPSTASEPIAPPIAATVESPPPAKVIEDLNSLLNLPPAPQHEPEPQPVTLTEAAPASSPDTPSPEPETPLPSALSITDTVKGKFKEIVPARVRQTDDGFMLLDERFQVRGEGTPENPIELTWDLLVSASETFQPRMQKLRFPERIAMLDGKHVRITGYVAFPIMAASQNELLSMRNMWDGCCIGVPPTPYDAIEVKLKESATGRDRFTSFGTVEGKMTVDPYVKGNWLLGLYILEDAKLSQLKQGDDPTKHGGM